MTTAIPLSAARPTWSWVIAAYTFSPRPPAPAIPPMTTIDRASMMTWLIPAMIVGRASGSCTRVRVCLGEVPKASAASTSSLSTWRMPSSVMRTPGGIAKTMVAITPGVTPTPKNMTPGIR